MNEICLMMKIITIAALCIWICLPYAQFVFSLTVEIFAFFATVYLPLEQNLYLTALSLDFFIYMYIDHITSTRL